MNAWSNIQASPEDPEIIAINDLEKDLGTLPDKVIKIRELITRFEVCHFKYRQHLKKIRDSINNLDLIVDPANIGMNHIHHGESAWKRDKTGKSMIGQQYILALKAWINDDAPDSINGLSNQKLELRIRNWLGKKTPVKQRLIRLLLARLTWNWESYKKLQIGGKFKDIELQACMIDICHHAFPKNLDSLLQGVGKMKAVKETEFEGCGSFDNKTKRFITREFLELNERLKYLTGTGKPDKKALTRIWLLSCLAKTIKEDVHLSKPIIRMPQGIK